MKKNVRYVIIIIDITLILILISPCRSTCECVSSKQDEPVRQLYVGTWITSVIAERTGPASAGPRKSKQMCWTTHPVQLTWTPAVSVSSRRVVTHRCQQLAA